jgi:4'-phosphopantetheinyl transferase EntD
MAAAPSFTQPEAPQAQTVASLQRLQRLFEGASVVIEQLGPDEDVPAPRPEEAAQVARAVSKRRREFAAGRHLVRRGLARLGGDAAGFADFVLLNDADRAPRWPAGVVGSITHTGAGDQAYCAVVLGRDSQLLAVGIDAEEAEPLEPELWKFVLTADERAALEREPAERRGLLAKVMFSAKECFYKAQYPLTRQFLGFQQVRISLDPAKGQFQAARVDVVGGVGEMSRCLGRYSMDGGLVLTGIAVSRGGPQC